MVGAGGGWPRGCRSWCFVDVGLVFMPRNQIRDAETGVKAVRLRVGMASRRTWPGDR